jgi:choline dehydrogenase-like flavoprotein
MIHRGAQVADELARDGAIADVVIVGSGAAGAAAACVLAEAGLDVLVLEEGAPLRPEDRRRDVFSGFAARWRDAGMQVAAGRGFMPVLQGVCVGGTTVVNGAIMHRLPPPIHDVWVRDHGAGRFFDAASLDRVFATLDAALDVAPTPATVAGENNRLMAVGFGAIGLPSTPIARNVTDCEASARCLQGCPTRRKHSMDETLLPRAFAAGARLIADCRVERVYARGGRAVGVYACIPCPRSGLPGPRLTIHARRAVILAASAVSTPLLLARSGLRGGAAGPVGHRFQGHPGTAVLAAFEAPVRMWQGATQGHESLALWDERMKFEALALPPELGAVRMPGLGPALGARMRDYGHIAQWAVQVRAEAHGRVGAGPFGGKTHRLRSHGRRRHTPRAGRRRPHARRRGRRGAHALPRRARAARGAARRRPAGRAAHARGAVAGSAPVSLHSGASVRDGGDGRAPRPERRLTDGSSVTPCPGSSSSTRRSSRRTSASTRNTRSRPSRGARPVLAYA